MGETKRDGVAGVPALQWPEIKRARFRYLGAVGGHKTDILTALFVEDCPSVYADVDGEVGVRYDPKSGCVAGVEIRGFEDSFLRLRHQGMAGEWAAIKPVDRGGDGVHSSGWLYGKGVVGLACALRDAVRAAASGPDWVARHLRSLDEYREYTAFILNSGPVEMPPLRWPEIRRVRYRYTGMIGDGVDTDILLALFVDNRYASSIAAGEGLLIRYDHGTGNVAGIAVEDFERHFLKAHPELADGWPALKPEGRGGFHHSPWLTGAAALDYARRLKALAHQGTLSPGWPAGGGGDTLLWSKFGVPD